MRWIVLAVGGQDLRDDVGADVLYFLVARVEDRFQKDSFSIIAAKSGACLIT